MSRVSAVLLAAGESRRMGAANKLLLPVEGVPMVRHMVQMLMTTNLDEIVVVLGYEALQVAALIDDLPVNIVINDRYAEGQMTSVYCGLAALSVGHDAGSESSVPCDGVMICLSDQPLLDKEDINTLINEFTAHACDSVLVPTWKGQRGNPIVLSSQHQASILAGEKNLGCKRFIENNPTLVKTYEMNTDHVVVDLDTYEAYQAFTHAHDIA